jgi:hypothetical protein
MTAEAHDHHAWTNTHKRHRRHTTWGGGTVSFRGSSFPLSFVASILCVIDVPPVHYFFFSFHPFSKKKREANMVRRSAQLSRVSPFRFFDGGQAPVDEDCFCRPRTKILLYFPNGLFFLLLWCDSPPPPIVVMCTFPQTFVPVIILC